MSKKVFVFLIISVLVFSFLVFSFRKVEAVTTWSEASCSLSPNTWACASDPIVSCTPARCASPSYGASLCQKVCQNRNNANPNSSNCTINPSSGIGTCSCSGSNCIGVGTCTITTNQCDYTCLTNYGNCDGNNANGCECSPTDCCDGNIRKYNCEPCNGATCSSAQTCANRIGCSTQDCGTTSSCSAGSCVTCPAGSSNCDQNAANGCECDLNTHQCIDGSCVLKNGQSCIAGSECVSTYCVDGVCCNVSPPNCAGTCQACNVAGSIGTCTTRPLNDNTECSACNYCNGNTTCQSQPDGPTGYLCTNSDYKCSNGACILTKEPNLHGWAWSENIGWISFNCRDRGICSQKDAGNKDRICDTDADCIRVGAGTCVTEKKCLKTCKQNSDCSGFGGTCVNNYCSASGSVCSSDSNCATTGGTQLCIARNSNNITPCDASYYGIYLPKYPASGDTCSETGDERCLKGYAWSDNIGWIRFDPPKTDTTSYGGNELACDYPHKRPSFYSSGEGVSGLIRACAGALNPDICEGIGGNSNSGGWDGWICLKGCESSVSCNLPYRVQLNLLTTPKEFNGWAWGGGGGNFQNAVVGWISFNCGEGGGCGASNNYKVTYEPLNIPPTVSNPDSSLNSCCYGSLYGCSTQVAQGFSVTFKWKDADVDGDARTAYEIWVDNDPNFTGAKFNYIVDPSNGSTAYTFNLNDDGKGYVPVEAGDWLSQLSFPATYYWKVRVRDAPGDWSGWSAVSSLSACSALLPEQSAPGCFKTPIHAHPFVNFKTCPSYVEPFLETQFCSQDDEVRCGTSLSCQAPSSQTECYGSTCTTWQWNIPDASSPDDNDYNPSYVCSITLSPPCTDPLVDCPGGSCIPDPSYLSPPPVETTVKNPSKVKFQTSGTKDVSLTVTDSTGLSCPLTIPLVMGLPLPIWKEIPPF